MIDSTIRLKKEGILYYLFLLIVLTTWTDSENLPPFPFRIAFLLAVLIPLWLKRSALLPEVLFSFIVISASSFAVSYMPVDGGYILVVVLLSVFIIGRVKGKRLKIPLSFKVLCVLSLIMDIFFSSGISSTWHWLSIIIVGECLLSTNDSIHLRFMALTIAVVSLVLSLEFILMGDRFISSVNTMDGSLDRKGWTDPNYFGALIGMGIWVSLVELMVDRRLNKIIRYMLLCTIIISLYTLFTTASRGAFVALSCASLIILFFAPIKNAYRVGALLMSCIILFIMYNLHMLDLLLLRFLSDSGDAGGRTEIWIPRMNAFFNECSPLQWFFGLGTDESMKLGTGGYLGFHNDYLAVLVKYGFVGFFCLLVLIVKPLLSCKTNKGLVFAGIVYLALCMLSIEPFTGGQWGCLYFYLFILLLSQASYEKI